MAIRQTDSGSVFIPDNVAGRGLMNAAEGANKIGNVYSRRKRGIWAFVGGAALVAGTLVPFIKNTAHSAKDTASAMADGASESGGLLPKICVGEACVGGEDATQTTDGLTNTTIAGGQMDGTPNLPSGQPENPVANAVEVPSGAGGLAVARLCLGVALDSPVTQAVKDQWARMQSVNTAAIADGLTAGETLSC
jgi:hypothetical protein